MTQAPDPPWPPGDEAQSADAPEAAEHDKQLSQGMVNDDTRAVLKHAAPEILCALDGLCTLTTELTSFTRPLGPDQAVSVLDGAEALNRTIESLALLATAVFERTGVPSDYGAKSTRGLIAYRHGLTHTEASRRVHLAQDLGGRVDLTGQALPPKYPHVAQAVHAGTLSTSHVVTITRLLASFPTTRLGIGALNEVETQLVNAAPNVRVTDLVKIYDTIMGYLDPDGPEPVDEPARDTYEIRLRALKDGTWDMHGHVDPITGGILHNWLISRKKTVPLPDTTDSDGNAMAAVNNDDDGVTDKSVAAVNNGAIAVDDGDTDNNAIAVVDDMVAEVFDQVLSGDRYDATDPTTPLLPVSTWPSDDETTHDAAYTAPTVDDPGLVPAGCGIRTDGTVVDATSGQAGVKEQIYTRFATLIAHTDMDHVAKGGPYALVITANATDLATMTNTNTGVGGGGRAGARWGETDTENPVSLTELRDHGLNGTVFGHLISQQAKTVAVTTENRFATAKQLTILASRDQGCTFPGCETPVGWCDAHHIVGWADGGTTSINNLTLACGVHNRMVETTDWHTVMLHDGRPAWVPPAAIDPARRPILHTRFIAREITRKLSDT